jgi:hypothetical protein
VLVIGFLAKSFDKRALDGSNYGIGFESAKKKNIVKNNNKEEKKNSFLFIALSKSITTWRGELHMGI